eukprot:9112448-Karenia_brevis.AAC.1
MRQRSTYEWMIPIVFPVAREGKRRSKRTQRNIQHAHGSGEAQPMARSKHAAAMRDTARMMKAPSPGAPPDAVAYRRYQHVQVCNKDAYFEYRAPPSKPRKRSTREC